MGGSWTFGRRLGAGFTLAALTLLVVAGFGYTSTEQLIETSRWVAHTHEVRTRLVSLSIPLTEAESAARAFALSGDERLTAEVERALASGNAMFAELRRLTADNPQQQRRLDTLRARIDARFEHTGRVIELRRREGLVAAAANVSTGEGRRLMDAVQQTIADMDQAEQQLLVARNQEADHSSRTARTVILWGSLLGSVFVGLLGFYIARSLSRQVGSAVRHIQSSSTELQSAANQQVTAAKEQATAMSEITTTISELLATARQIAESSRRVSGIADETASSARLGDETVQRTSESIGTIQRQVDLIVSHMLDLGRKSQQIGGILELINELAEQTNILAINATIEAAGAGESGKRFAVVAEEIRRLSDRVGVSTKEIRQLIEDIRAAVNKTVMTTEGGNKAVEAGARLFGDVTKSFSQIASLVVTTTEAAREIELSTKQQSTAVEQVNVAVANVAQASRETESSSGQTLQTASQLAALSRELLKVVQAQANA
jgi:methyl-accepting chemotaxis protein